MMLRKPAPRKLARAWFIAFAAVGLIAAVSEGINITRVAWAQENREAHPVSSGRVISPAGEHVGVGAFPANALVSPDGKFLITTDTGYRQELCVVELETNKVVDRKSFDGTGPNGKKDEIYFGLAFGTSQEGKTVLYVSRGGQNLITRYVLDDDGKLEFLPGGFQVPDELAVGPVAGLAVEPTTGTVAAAINGATKDGDHHGYILYFSPGVNLPTAKVEVPGYPLDVAFYGGLTYTSCERDGVVATLTADGLKDKIKTGANPTKLLTTLDGVWVANSGSDTISLIQNGEVEKTLTVRPAGQRSLPISTPLDIAPAQDGQSLFVALGDLNAVGVMDLTSGALKGLIPTGWYPTSVKVSPDGESLLVASAKGVMALNPNGRRAGPNGQWGTYDLNILQGAVSKISIKNALAGLEGSTKQVLANLRVGAAGKFYNPGIKHAIYIIKENRTYDQVFGDIATGNGDPKLTMFGEAVTPNQHALAKRFLLLDNFHTCAEVSADGWNWSTSGMVNEYTARNVPNNYSRRRPSYDYEGANGDVVPDRDGVNDVAEAPCGYIWDNALKHGVTLRNYGFFVGDVMPWARAPAATRSNTNQSLKKAMQACTDTSFRHYDLALADSDLWTKIKVRAPRQMVAYGEFGSNSRFAEWKREFDGYVKNKNLPGLSLIRLPRDHTGGTAPENWSPRAMVADNDYAVGEIVEAVSHSPYWKSTAIFVLEDDSQAGVDHVDCHRSPALVISPYLEKGGKDSRFYNTDSMLHTIESILGMPPMNSYDALASTFRFSHRAANLAPYSAIMPDKKIAGDLNAENAYRAADSARLVNRFQEDTAADLELSDILWHSIMGNRPMPKVKGSRYVDAD
jgi:DNA-binding beta-propeller fold protein YncE